MGKTWGDYECLAHGLKKAGREDLLPAKPVWPARPIAWWSTVRDGLGLGRSDLNLGLGFVYRLIFPDYGDLLHRWHNAGADVQMTIRLIVAYFRLVRGAPIPGKIESYFLAASGEPSTMLRQGDQPLKTIATGNEVLKNSAESLILSKSAGDQGTNDKVWNMEDREAKLSIGPESLSDESQLFENSYDSDVSSISGASDDSDFSDFSEYASTDRPFIHIQYQYEAVLILILNRKPILTFY